MSRIPVAALALVALVIPLDVSATPDPQAELRAAIDSIRGVSFSDLGQVQRTEVGKRLDAAWRTLLARPKEAKALVAEALDAELDDRFFILELSYLYPRLDPDPADLERVAGWLLRSDPNVFPARYFKIAAGMASARCEACKPAVLRMLELNALEASIPGQTRQVDLTLGLIFTVVSYGDSILPELEKRLTAPDCSIRANAALAIGLSLPSELPEQVAVNANFDNCPRARVGALLGLAVADPPKLTDLFDTRMEGQPASEELMGFVQALAQSSPRLAVPRLNRLTNVPYLEVVEGARSALKLFESAGPYKTARLSGSDAPAARKKMRSALAAAVKQGRFEHGASAEEIVAALSPKDYALLNDARRAVLRRLSDQALSEFYTLHKAALMFREAARPGGE